MVILARAGRSTALEQLNEYLAALVAQGATAEVQGKRARGLSRPRPLQDARVSCTSGRLLWRYHSAAGQPALRVPLYSLRVQSWTLEPTGAVVVYAQGGERLRVAPVAHRRSLRERSSRHRFAAGSTPASRAALERRRRRSRSSAPVGAAPSVEC